MKILDEAEGDLEEGFRFYESLSPGLGAHFLDALFADIDSLRDFAGIHPVVFGNRRALSKRFPFAVYYQIIEDTAVVIAVLDCRRRPSWTKRRLSLGSAKRR